MIKAIETRYKGYRFRSRLEAKWAVFFDALGIEWQYEPEGFDLGEYGWYLPDFWLTDWNLWVEIKPANFEIDGIAPKLRYFADMDMPIACFGGTPGPSWTGTVYCHDLSDSSGGSYENECGFDWCTVCKKAVLSISDTDRKFLRGDRELFEDNCFSVPLRPICAHRNQCLCGPIADAAEYSLSARFEHGETPGHRR